MRSLSSYRRELRGQGDVLRRWIYLPNSLTVLQLRPRPSDALRGRLIAAPNSIQLTMIDSKTATTTVFISSPRTLCTLTTRRMELLRTVVSVTPNVAEQPIAR
jgi:hypothetical protein